MDHLGLEQAVDGLGECVVVAVADAADGGLDPGFSQPLGLEHFPIQLDREVVLYLFDKRAFPFDQTPPFDRKML